MATNLSTLLTAAGCNVTTATIIFQSGVGQTPGIGSGRVDNTTAAPLNGQSTTGGTDPRLTARFVAGAGVPRCIAIDSTYIYVLTFLSNFPVQFIRIPITATSYTTGNMPIPIIMDNPTPR